MFTPITQNLMENENTSIMDKQMEDGMDTGGFLACVGIDGRLSNMSFVLVCRPPT